MIRIISVLAFVHYGSHPQFALWYLSLLHQMRHYIITAYGVDETYFPPIGLDIEGIGQGSTIVGHAWTFLDSFITRYYKRLVPPLKCFCPKNEFTLEKASEAFVDDRKLWTIGDNVEEICSNIKQNVEIP